MPLSSLELCAGAGGQAIGLEVAGYDHEAVVEIDHDCCNTLRLNRPNWTVLEQDMKRLKGKAYAGIDLFAAGLPCPPFSIAGQKLGVKDERNLFPAALRLIDEIRPRAIMIENVRGFLEVGFEKYRETTAARWPLQNGLSYRVAYSKCAGLWRVAASAARRHRGIEAKHLGPVRLAAGRAEKPSYGRGDAPCTHGVAWVAGELTPGVTRPTI